MKVASKTTEFPGINHLGKWDSVFTQQVFETNQLLEFTEHLLSCKLEAFFYIISFLNSYVLGIYF